MIVACEGRPHLGYCTNIHAGESWAEVKASLARYLPAVKARVSPGAPFGVGLRLSARAADELSAPGELDALRAFFAEHDLYVFTINGFSHGTFHGARVKEEVYRPDWLEDARVAYTERLAELLAALLPEGRSGTISTVPGAFGPRVRTEAHRAAMAHRLLRVAASLDRLHERTGRDIALALEPEPFCHAATIAQTVAFFEEHVFARAALDRLARAAKITPAEAEHVARRHLGVCFDACHMAVELEPIPEALGALAAAGIRVPKVQISAGLEVDASGPAGASLAELARFADDVYLHQVTERAPSGLVRYLDLPEAIAAAEARGGLAGPWRIHFHVPIFRERLDPFRSTQPYVAELLDRLASNPPEPGLHLEVETYTWGVLPEEHRREPIEDAIAREIAWAHDRLTR